MKGAHRLPWTALGAAGLVLFLSACTAPPPTLDATRLAAAGAGTLEALGTQAAEHETLGATALWPTATATPTDTPTATITPSPTATDTPSPTPLPSGTVIGAGRLRAGPGQIYPVMANLAGGETARPLGQTTAGDWLLVVLEVGEEGWVLADNFAFDNQPVELSVITDLPPTPTLPPATLTATLPPPWATWQPSPYACDLTASQDPSSPHHVILVGQNWPPNEALTATRSRVIAGTTETSTGSSGIVTGDADDLIPNGFWVQIYSPSVWLVNGLTVPVTQRTYTLTSSVCSATATINP